VFNSSAIWCSLDSIWCLMELSSMHLTTPRAKMLLKMRCIPGKWFASSNSRYLAQSCNKRVFSLDLTPRAC
jgi:hypothetical protein